MKDALTDISVIVITMSPALNNFLEDRRQRDPTHAVEIVLLILRLIFYFGK